jgi:hypothetical protein
MTRRRKRAQRLAALFTWLIVWPLACGDDDGVSDGDRPCGDGRCSADNCESIVRCPEDCGNCVGVACMVGGTNGSCGESCQSSCDCANQGELCTKDYGLESGVCIPTACLACNTLSECSYQADANGKCDAVTCS